MDTNSLVCDPPRLCEIELFFAIDKALDWGFEGGKCWLEVWFLVELTSDPEGLLSLMLIC